MNRQYVGARYVPKFTQKNGGTWSNTYSYEALEIVKYGDDFYTAKRPVPTGIALTDSYYWVLTGNYNGAMQSLSDRIDTCENHIDTLSHEVDTCKRTAYYFGNSYTYGINEESGKGLYFRTKQLFNKSNVQTSGGAGFLNYTNHNITFQTLLNNVLASPNRLPDDEVTDVIVLSAWGDTMAIKNRGGLTGACISAFENALGNFATTCRNSFPNLKRIVLSLVEIRGKRDITNTSEGTSYYHEPFMTHSLFKSIANKYGIEYTGWVGWEGFMRGTNLVQTDYYHPTNAGNIILSQALISALCGCWTPSVRQRTFRTPSEINEGCYVNGEMILTPDVFDINLNFIETAAGATAEQYSNINLFKFYDDDDEHICVPCVTKQKDTSLCNIYIATTPNNPLAFSCKGTVKSDNGKMYIQGATYSASETLQARQNVSSLPRSFKFGNSIIN